MPVTERARALIDWLFDSFLVRGTVNVDSAAEELFTEANPGQIAGEVTGRVISDTYIADEPATDDNPMPGEEIIRTGDEWVELINGVFDDVVASRHSDPYDVRGYSGVAVHIFVDSTAAPTDIRVLPRFSPDYDGVMLPTDAIWSNFEEGLWASLFWEDADNAGGEWRTYYLPCAGQDWMMIAVRAAGTTAVNMFNARVIVRKFRGPHSAAHA